LAGQLVRQRRFLLPQLLQTADVGTVRRANQIRQHVHVAEDATHEIPTDGRMREHRPIGTGDVAGAHGFVPRVA
jgi:hypothetical protein